MILTKAKIKNADIDKIVYDKVKNGLFNELLLIVPTNRKARYLKRELISASENLAASNINIETLATISLKIFDDARNFKATILTEPTAIVLLNQSFAVIDLKYFSQYKKEIPRGTLELVKNVITEYKRLGITPDKIVEETEKLTGSEKLKAEDIAAVYSAYNEKIKKLSAYELGDVYKFVNNISRDQFLDSFSTLYPKVNTIVANGFDEFSDPEIDLINSLSSIEGSNLYLSFDYFKKNDELFSHLESCHKKLTAKGFEEVEDSSTSEFDNFRSIVRENLFLESKVRKLTSPIELVEIKASTPDKEIEIVAKEIKRLVISNEFTPDEICVASNSLTEHSVLIRDIFPSFGIPFNLTDRFSLSNSPPVIAIINFLEILEHDFYYKNIFRALSGRWVTIDNVDLSNLLKVSSNLKLISGYRNWVTTLENVIYQIENSRIDEENNYLPLFVYKKALEDFKAVSEKLNVFRGKKSIPQFKENLLKMIIELNIHSKLINDNTEYIERNVKAVTTFVETINELFDLLIDEFGSSKEYGLGIFLKQIKTSALFARYNVKEKHGQGVLVTSTNEIRGLKFKVLFLIGMVDGEFPTKYKPAIFFSGNERTRRDEKRHLLEERYRFYQALCVPEKLLYLTHASKQEKREFSASTFLNDLFKLLPAASRSDEDYNSLIFTKEEYAVLNETVTNKNEKLRTEISIDETRKINPFSESEFTGYIQNKLNDEAQKTLETFKQKEYSATQLENYAKCPFQYFAKRILTLESIEEPSEEFEAFEIGSLLHNILYDFYVQIKEKDLILQNCSEKDFQKHLTLIFNIAEEKVKDLNFVSPVTFYDREKIFGINGIKENSLLYNFVKFEREFVDGFVPTFFESAFGSFSINDNTKVVEINGTKLRGKIDRIDIDEKNTAFKVIDYKLGGSKPTKDELLNGISLQLPIYLYASKLMIKAELGYEYQPQSAEIYSLKLIEKSSRRKSIGTTAKSLDESQQIGMNNEMIEIALSAVKGYVDGIANGDFRLSQLKDRENKVCRFCDFKSICRIQEIN